jgi:polyhydroxybutyrate depolymerase
LECTRLIPRLVLGTQFLDAKAAARNWLVRTSLSMRRLVLALAVAITFGTTPAAAQTTPRPLLLLLHGSSQQGADALYETQLDKRAEELNAIVLAPSGQGGLWRPSDLTPLQALIKTAIADGTADAARIVVAGFSNGGDMAWRLACSPEVPIAAVVVAGMPIAKSIAAGCAASQPVRVMVFGGTADPLVPYHGGALPIFDGFGVLSTDQTAAFWATRNDCTHGPFTVESRPATPRDRVAVNQIEWQGCRAPVQLFSLVGGGHVWPNQPGFHALSYQRLRGPISRSVDTVHEIAKLIAELPSGLAEQEFTGLNQ